MSRRKSSPAASPKAAPRGSSAAARPKAGARPGVYVQSPQSDAYVAMLGVALGALLLGTLFLVLKLNSYGFDLSATGA